MAEPNDPSALTRFFVAHPWRAALLSGALILGWGLALDLPAVVSIALGAALFAFTGLMWRSGGPAHRFRAYMLRRFPKRN